LRRARVASSSNVRDWRVRILTLGVREIALSADIAMRAADLEDLSGDPVDRIIVATTLVEQAVLLTADMRILEWRGDVQRLDAQR
jgi:PIN domain nuclease of toxin-antitoxin system